MGKQQPFYKRIFQKENTKHSAEEGALLTSSVSKESLCEAEEISIENLISRHAGAEQLIEKDAERLKELTAEVKSISNQAVILHGERIEKAQHLLKDYKEGAFTSWLLITYGNRQTPYNFLQYYKFYTSLSLTLKEKMQQIPRQAIYTLASREGDQKRKEAIVENYEGETKTVLLGTIRKEFPLQEKDKRRGKKVSKKKLIATLLETANCWEGSEHRFSRDEKADLLEMLKKIKTQLSS